VLSRYRELAADRAGAYLTGKPSALASALVKLNNGMNAIPDRDIRKAEAMNAFAFTPAFKSGGRKGFTQLFSTHPSTEKRLEQLARIANDLGKPF
jgi:heat shock protein HtpX